MKRAIKIVLLFLIVLIILLFILPYPAQLLTGPLKEQLEKKISQEINYPFSIGNIRFLFLNRAIIEGVSIGVHAETADIDYARPVSCDISRIIIYFNLFSLIKNRKDPLVAIRKVKISQFNLNVMSDALMVTGERSVTIPDILWEKGTVRIVSESNGDDKKSVITINDYKGSVRASAAQYSISMDAVLPHTGAVSVKGTRDHEGNWEGTLNADIHNISYDDIYAAALIFNKDTDLVSRFSGFEFNGTAQLTIQSKGTIKQSAPFIDEWVMRVNIDSSTIQHPYDNHSFVYNAHGIFSIDKDSITVSNAYVTHEHGSRLKVNGHVYAPFTDRVIDLDLNEVHLVDKDIPEFLLPPWVRRFAYEGTASGKLSGKLSDPELSMDISHGLWVHRNSLKGDLSLQLNYKNDNWRFSNILINTAEGIIRGEAHGKTRDWFVSASINAVDVQHIVPAFTKVPITGIMDGSLTFTWNPEQPELSGTVSIRSFSVLKQHYDTIFCKIRYVQNRTTLEAYSPLRDFEVTLDVRHKNNNIILNQAIINSPALIVQSSGIIIDKEGSMDVSIVCSDIPISHLPGDHKIFNAIRGKLSFNGSVKGTISNAVLIGKISASDDAGEFFSTEVSVDKKSIRFLNSSLLENITGSCIIDLRNNELELFLNEHNFEIAQLQDFVAMPINLKGIVSGKQHIVRTNISDKDPGVIQSFTDKIQSFISHKPIQKSAYAWHGEGNIIINDGSFNGVGFKIFRSSASIDENAVRITEIVIIQEKGSMRGKGKININESSDNIDFSADFKQLAVKKVIFDGSLTFQGDYVSPYDIRTEVVSPSVWINGQHAGELNGKIFYTERMLTFEDWTLGTFLSGSVCVDFNPDTPTLGGDLTFKLDDLQFLNELTPIEHKHSVKGSGRMNMKLEGTLINPIARITLNIPNAAWEGLQFGINGLINYKDNTWEIPRVECDFRKKGNLVIEGEYGLVDGKKYSHFNAQLKDLDFSVLRYVTELPEWIKGKVNGVIRVSGDVDNPQFSGTLNGGKTIINKIAFDHWQGSMTLEKNKLLIKKLMLTRKQELWTLTEGSYVNFLSENRISFLANMEIRNIYIGRVSLFGGLTVRGDWDFEKRSSQNFEIMTNNLWVNQYDFERVVIPFVVENGVITFTPIATESYQMSGSVDVSSYPVVHIRDYKVVDNNKTIIHADGTVSEQQNDFWFKTLDVDAGNLLELLGYEKIITGKTSMYWVMSGSLNNPRIVCTASIVNGSFKNVPFDKARIHWTLRDNIVHIENGEVISSDVFKVTAQGTIPITKGKNVKETDEQKPVDLSIRIEQGDLKVLSQAFTLFKSARGSVTGMLDIKGSPFEPLYSGTLSITDGQLTARKYFKTMRNINVRITFDNASAVIEQCTAQLGEGNLVLTGMCELGYLNIKQMNIHLTTPGKKGIKVEAPMLPISSSPIFKKLTTTSRGTPRADLTLSGTLKDPRIAGTVYLDHTYFTFPPSAEMKKNMKKADNFIINFIRNTTWDLLLIAEDNTWYENKFANAMIQGTIAIKGRRPDFKVNGKIISGKGSIGFLGSEFRIKNAELEIIAVPREGSGEQRKWKNILYLAGTAQARVFYNEPLSKKPSEDTILMIMDRAPIGKLKPRFTSKNDPQLASDKALERATGYDSASIDPRDRDILLRRGIVQLLDASLTTPLARNIARQTGLIDTVRISHETLPEDDAVPLQDKSTVDVSGGDLRDAFLGTKYTIGKQLSSKLLLEYSMQIIGSSANLDLRHELELSYRLQGNTFIRGIADLNQPYTGLEPERKAVIEKQWRFSWKDLLHKFISKDE